MQQFMRRVGSVILLTFMLIICISCENQYQQGYENGYEEGYLEGYAEGLEKAQERASSYSHNSSSPYVKTEVCGGLGVNVDGKHYSPGPTGCVRVYSDGTVEPY